MRLVFLHQAPYSQRDFSRFGIELLRARGFEVETWDLSAVIHPGGTRRAAPAGAPGWSGHRTFTSAAQACRAVEELPSGSWAVFLFPYSLRSLPVFRTVSRSGVRYAMFMANLMPPLARRDWQRVSGLAKLTPRRVLQKVFSLIPPGSLGVRPADLALAGGAKSLREWPVLGPGTRTVWGHMLDYDIYMASRAGPAAPIGVFLDEYLPFHPDYFLTGSGAPVTAQAYYRDLCAFFSQAERSLGIEVVVAAHPHADYDAHPGVFEGRRVVRGRTLELLRSCRAAFAHASTSINYAVLLSKPVVFLTSGELRRDQEGAHIESISGLLGKTPIDIDEPGRVDWEGELAVDAPAYAAYRNDYIKKDGSPDKPFWEIAASAISGEGSPG